MAVAAAQSTFPAPTSNSSTIVILVVNLIFGFFIFSTAMSADISHVMGDRRHHHR